jgi:hypothetical protein
MEQGNLGPSLGKRKRCGKQTVGSEPCFPGQLSLLPAQVALFLSRQEPAEGILLALPIPSNSNCSQVLPGPLCSPIFYF